MPVKTVTKTLFECTCFHSDCKHHKKPWTTEKLPARCAGCKRRTWNRPARISRTDALTLGNETHSIAEWSRKLGLAKTTIPWRIKQGWPMDQVLTKDDWRVQRADDEE